MTTYKEILKETTQEFFEDVCTVPSYAARAILHLTGCVFLLCFVIVSPIFLPMYAWTRYRTYRVARRMLYVTHDFVGDLERGKFFK